MAKKSMIERDLKRAKIVKRFAAKRAALKEIIGSAKSTDEERMDAIATAAGIAAQREPVAHA